MNRDWNTKWIVVLCYEIVVVVTVAVGIMYSFRTTHSFGQLKAITIIFVAIDVVAQQGKLRVDTFLTQNATLFRLFAFLTIYEYSLTILHCGKEH